MSKTKTKRSKRTIGKKEKGGMKSVKKKEKEKIEKNGKGQDML